MRARILAASVVATLSLAAAAAAHDADLSAQTQAPTNVTATTAVLHGAVDPGGDKSTYWFEVGTTTAYGIVTQPASTGKKEEAVRVTHGIDGLAAGTTYHVR